MKWSWRIGRIASISIYMHATFLILLGWVGVTRYVQAHSLAAAMWAPTFILVLFGIVVLHELRHALTARRFGIGTRDMTLLPIGGVARLDRVPEQPRQELLVALAGPAVSVVLAICLYVVLLPILGQRLLSVDEVLKGGFLVSVALFNLLPAFPMDGGRVLRAVLAMRIDYVRAT